MGTLGRERIALDPECRRPVGGGSDSEAPSRLAVGAPARSDRHARGQRSSPQLAMITAIGGSTAATTDMTTAAVVDHNRTRFQASRISTRQTPIKAKYHR
jgi:hypothetical protein